MKDFNASLYPLARGWYQLSDVNITYYYMKFMPGWPEQYVVGRFRARDPGWSARLVAVSRAGNPGGTYAISLGGQPQITDQQDAGPFVPTTAQLVWTTATTGRYSVLARAIFQQGGITAWQWVNFTAEPMQRLYQQTFSCGVSSISESFNWCSSVQYNYGWTGASNTTLINLPYQVVTYGPEAWVEVSSSVGNPAPSLRLLVDGANSDLYGVAALVIDLTALGQVSTASTFSIEHLYGWIGGDTRNNIAYLEFKVRRPDGSVVKLYLVRDDGILTTQIFDVVEGTATAVCSYSVGSGPGSCPAGHVVIRLGTLSTSWSTFYSGSIDSYVGIGVVEKIALVAVDRFSGRNKWRADFFVYWDNFAINGWSCTLSSNVATYTRGQSLTQVYVDPRNSPSTPPSLATEVDAYGNTGNVNDDYGYAVAVYRLPAPIPAAGTAISVRGLYQRDSNDASNNAAFVSVGVDTNGDGAVDMEYIYYRTDGTTYAIVSSFINPGQLICAGACADTTQFKFIALGSMASENSYAWSISLGETPGAVLGVAFGVVDASGYADGASDDFWVFWDDLTITYSACGLPSGWSASGKYAWQSNNYLLATGSVVVYRGLVPNALTYLSNFTGVGAFAVFDSSFNVIFGVFKTGSSFSALCGPSAVALGTLPAAKYVELRPLNGFGDVIIRDQSGAVLARYGCTYSTTPQYVGYKTDAGQILKAYSIETWG
ncbi:hypothetical protein [Pyrobaculum aerophilum]|nr:hypothetical protein [Pyrobaculum aerophilum]